MNANVNPWVAVLVIALFTGLLGGYFWATGETAKITGIGHLHSDPSGGVYVQAGRQLFRYGPTGAFQEVYGLEARGVTEWVGDFGFFSNGDVLLRRGSYKHGVLDNLANFLRFRNTTPLAAPDEDSGLVRCDLTQVRCQRFGDGSIDYNRAFHLVIDRRRDEVYVADTTRHTVRKLDREGRQLAERGADVRFPNAMFLFEGRLYVADTNHHAVQIVETATDGFGVVHQTIDVVPGEARTARQIWPYAVARVGAAWWVINLRGNMRHGGLYVFDEDWRYLKRIPLPEAADPGDLVVMEDRVLLGDSSLNVIYQFDHDGKRLVDFSSSELASALAEIEAKKTHYERIGSQFIVAFGVALTLGMALAIVVTVRARAPVRPPDGAERSVSINDPRIVWLSPSRKLVRQAKWLLIVVGLLLITISALSLQLDVLAKTSGIYLGLLLIMGAVFYIAYVQLKTRIGVLDDMLILEDYRGRIAVGKEERIRYSSAFIVIDQVFVGLGNGAKRLYPEAEMMRHVHPLLLKGRELENRQMQTLLLQHGHPVMVIGLLIILGTLAAMLFVPGFRDSL